MSNKIKKEMEKIKIPRGLNDRSRAGVSQAKQEMKHRKPHKYIKRIGLVAAIITVAVLVVLLNQDSANQHADYLKEDSEPEIVYPSRMTYTLWEATNEAEIIANLTVTELVDVVEVAHFEDMVHEYSIYKATVNDYFHNELDYGEEIEFLHAGGPNRYYADDPLLEIDETYILFLDNREDENLGTNLVMTGGPTGRYNKDGDAFVRQLNSINDSDSLRRLTEAELTERLNRYIFSQEEIDPLIINANYPAEFDEESLFERADLVVVGHTNLDFINREHVIDYIEDDPDHIADYYTKTEIKISEIIKQPSTENFSPDDDLMIIEPMSIISHDDGTMQKIIRSDYQEIEKDDQYLLYLGDNTFGDYGIINAFNGRFNLDQEEKRKYVVEVDYSEDEEITAEKELIMTHEKILEAARKRLKGN